MSSSEYATLEEAFGVASFLAPDPPVLRGDVGKVSEARHKNLQKRIQTSYVTPRSTALRHRLPVEIERCPAGVPCPADAKKSTGGGVVNVLARAHALGGAKAAWKLVPDSARADMMWYAVRQSFDSDFVFMIFLGICLFVLFK
jgi:hypothetical protein